MQHLQPEVFLPVFSASVPPTTTQSGADTGSQTYTEPLPNSFPPEFNPNAEAHLTCEIIPSELYMLWHVTVQVLHPPDQNFEGSQWDFTLVKSQGSTYNYIKKGLNISKSRICKSQSNVYVILPPS